MIFILEDNGDQTEITHIFENRNISRFIYVDGKWIYALQRGAIAFDNVIAK